MRRMTIPTLLWTVVGLTGNVPLRAQDTIRYVERTISKETAGSIVEESPASVVLRPTGTGSKEVAAPDILDITYEVPTLIRPAYRGALSEERKMTDPSVKEEERKKA